jgi:hypothetical protein
MNEIQAAMEVGIDLRVSLNVISKSEDHFGEEVSLLSHSIDNDRFNSFARAVLNDLATEIEQASHSISKGTQEFPNFEDSLINKLKGNFIFSNFIILCVSSNVPN